ncbi:MULTISPECIES: MFS transporter [Streptomyces violaceusniger group]|uniref:MFS transporter n=2 Tax=Streptomyces javensis TaxID=114698 RepID=A0ABS0R6D3_9ACTN|nr:MFS transporter [Streptomyces javensis]MBI0312307.1 MFS transporter [Streptomyces javensis]
MSTTAPGARGNRWKTIAAASTGNFAEWYDWGIYGVVATLLAKEFFPSGNDALALISVYALFAISYLTRPLGAAIFGHIGDSIGRRRAMAGTITITCGSTALIGCIPSYHAIGIAAPILLLLIRLAQSLGTGGEHSTSTSLVYESTQDGRKARAVALLAAGTFLGLLAGSLLATGLSAVLSEHAFEAWGWRVLFWLSLPMGGIGLYMRRHTDEGEEFTQAKRRQGATTQAPAAPLVEALRTHWARMLLFMGYLGTWTIVSAVLTSYLATFLQKNDALSSTQVYAANTFASVVVIICALLFAPLTDRIGLRNASVLASILVAVLVLPGFLLADRGVIWAFTGAGLLGASKGVLSVPSRLAVSQIFPANIRATAGGLSYNTATSVLGGTAPLLAVALNDAFGSNLVFCSYVIFAALVTLAISLTSVRHWTAESEQAPNEASRDTPTPV